MPYASGLPCNLDPPYYCTLSCLRLPVCCITAPLASCLPPRRRLSAVNTSRPQRLSVSVWSRPGFRDSGESGRPSARLAARHLAVHEALVHLLM